MSRGLLAEFGQFLKALCGEVALMMAQAFVMFLVLGAALGGGLLGFWLVARAAAGISDCPL